MESISHNQKTSSQYTTYQSAKFGYAHVLVIGGDNAMNRFLVGVWMKWLTPLWLVQMMSLITNMVMLYQCSGGEMVYKLLHNVSVLINVYVHLLRLTAFHLWFHIWNHLKTSILRAELRARSLLPDYFVNIRKKILYTDSTVK